MTYVNAPKSDAKKHDCPDCRVCQLCSDSRCGVCRSQGCQRRPISMARQIDLHRKLNADDDHPPWKPLKIED